MTLSAPQGMVWNYFEALRRRIAAIPDRPADDETKQDITVCLTLAVAVVEVFLNVYCRVVVSEDAWRQHEDSVLTDLRRRRSIEYKLREWPLRLFGKRLDVNAPRVAAFYRVKARRNALMHFTSSHETVSWMEEHDGEPRAIVIQGLADISAFASLERQDAVDALEAAEGLLCEVFLLRGVPEQRLPDALHLWTGKVPGSGPVARLSFSVPIGPVQRG